MEKIFLASTNKIFINGTIKDIKQCLPSFDKEVSFYEKKADLLSLLKEGHYDLVIMDTTLISFKELYTLELSEGLVWLVDKEKASEKISRYFFLWSSNDEYKETLAQLDKSFEAHRVSNTKTNIGEQKAVEKGDITESVISPIEQTIDDEYVEPLEEEHEKKEQSAISIAPPYPNELTNTVQSRLKEAKNVHISEESTDFDKNEDRLVELQRFVDEYFSLIPHHEALKKTDKRLLASLEMYKYINMNNASRNNVIGIWSPIRGIGVTTFVMNFAFHIGDHKRLPISVMEGLKNQPMMYRELERISTIDKIAPSDWVSYVSFLNNFKRNEGPKEVLAAKSVIDYKGVYWFPLGKGREDYRDSVIEDIPYYLTLTNPKDVLLVDLPNGEFKKDTRSTIKRLNELWILMDGSTDLIFSYENYLKQLQHENPHLKISIILLDYFPFVSEKLIKKRFDFPILTKLPDLNDEIRKNKYERAALMDNPAVESLLQKSFAHLGVHVYKNSYKQENNFSEKKTSQKFFDQFIKKLRVF